jgi:uncharacterized membrane protein YqaE (UPF0057 family)
MYHQAEFWICLLLTILGYIPGIIYAVYVLLTNSLNVRAIQFTTS